jgi:hypothetical protein
VYASRVARKAASASWTAPAAAPKAVIGSAIVQFLDGDSLLEGVDVKDGMMMVMKEEGLGRSDESM